MPSLKGILYFLSINITKFLKRFNELYNKYQIINKKTKLLKYYNSA